MTNNTQSQFASVSSRNYHARLFENILALDHFLDAVVTTAEGKRIQVHRFVLAAGSKYFSKMLRCDDSNKLPIFVFNDISFDHMKRIVQYLYTGKTQIRIDELDEFFRVAERLEILGLHREIESGDLSVVGSTTQDMHNISHPVSNFVSSVERRAARAGQNGKRKRDSKESNRNKSQSTSSQRSDDHKRARAEKQQKSAETAKVRTVHLPRPSTLTAVPTPRTNGTAKSGSKESALENGAPNAKEKNDDQQNTDGNPSTSDDSNDKSQHLCVSTGCGMSFETAEELQRHKKHTCGKKKEFKCQTCQKSFYLRIQLMNHYKSENNQCVSPMHADESTRADNDEN